MTSKLQQGKSLSQQPEASANQCNGDLSKSQPTQTIPPRPKTPGPVVHIPDEKIEEYESQIQDSYDEYLRSASPSQCEPEELDYEEPY